MATNAKIRQPLKQRLSKLNLRLAGKMLGEGGSQLIRQGGAFDIDAEQVFLGDDLLRLEVGESTVTMTVVPAPERLYWNCSTCYEACEHVGAAIAIILE